jgi:transcriptional regulator with XRE-family HTH domain
MMRGMTVFQASLPARLRGLRRARGLTLERAAAAAGVHKGHLSRVERGEKAPSPALVERLAEIYGLPLAQMFGQVATEGDVVITRRPAGGPGRAGAGGVERLPLPASAGARAYVLHPTDIPDDGHGRLSHGGWELAYVLAGTVELTVADRRERLEAGDSAAFAGHLPHGFRRLGEAAAAVLLVMMA